jgi:hypothetical protein
MRDISVKNIPTWRAREWRMDNIAAQKIEPLMPAANDQASWLDISSVASWKQIADWYREISSSRYTLDISTRAKAAEITRNAKTENEKLRAIYRYVAQDLQYQSTPFRLSLYVPTEGKQVIRQKYADSKDKSALFTALCAAVGIKSCMALLNERDSGDIPYLPSPRFNHAMAVVQSADGPLWIDVTADHMAFGDLPVDVQGVPALLIEDGTTDLTTTPILAAERNLAADSHIAQLDAKGRLTGTVELSVTGDWGRSVRSAIGRLPQNQRDEALGKIASRLIKNARSLGGTLVGMDNPDRAMQIKVTYDAARFGDSAGNALTARLPWENSSENGLAALWNNPNRTQSIEVAQYRGLYLGTVRLQLPEGYSPQELPTEIKDETPWGRYRFSYKMEDNTLLATREVLFTALRVETKDAPEYAAFLKAIHQETERQLALKK